MPATKTLEIQALGPEATVVVLQPMEGGGYSAQVQYSTALADGSERGAVARVCFLKGELLERASQLVADLHAAVLEHDGWTPPPAEELAVAPSKDAVADLAVALDGDLSKLAAAEAAKAAEPVVDLPVVAEAAAPAEG